MKVPLAYSVSDDIFIKFVNQSNRLSDIAKLIGYSSQGSSLFYVKRRIDELGLTTDHFDNWNSRGNTPTIDLLVYGSDRDNQTIKKRIISENILPYVCVMCGNEGIYNNLPLVLHLDHNDGDSNNNVLENLRFLCPNCHSQTTTYGGRNNKGKTRKKVLH